MELKPGYKQTEVGVIPEEWNVRLLPEVCRFRSGRAHEQYISDTGPFICVNSKFISTDGEVRKFSTANFCPANKGDVLMVMSDLPNGRALAKAYLVEADETYAVNQRVCALTAYGDCPEFLFYVLNRSPYFLKFDNGVSQTHLLNDVFQKCPLPVPPDVDEQRAIAEVLSDVDRLLGGLDRLIAKKRDLKQAAMQQLLTGRIRLPGFQGEWEMKRLSEIVSTPITDGPHLTPKFLRDGIPFLSVNNLVENKLDFSSLRFISREDHEEFSRKCRPKRGDILFGKAASIGQVALIETDIELNIWSPLALIRVASSASARFVLLALQTRDVYRQIGLMTNASSQGNIGMSDIGRIGIPLPGVPEQTAIAEVLSNMEAELAALKQRREKTRALKQAMMQELLTGKTRLVQTETANA